MLKNDCTCAGIEDLIKLNGQNMFFLRFYQELKY